jgi:hypothetical protein
VLDADRGPYEIMKGGLDEIALAHPIGHTDDRNIRIAGREPLDYLPISR